MSKTNSKKKVISLWIIALIILSGFYAGFYYAAHFNNQELKAESETKNILEKKFFTSGLDQETTDQENTFDSSWYLGESVEADIEFNHGTIDFYNPIYEFWYDAGGGDTGFSEANTAMSHYWNLWTDNAQYTIIHSRLVTNIGTSTVQRGLHVTFKMYCGGAGTLTYDFFAKYFNTPTGYVSSNFLTDTYEIESSDLDSEGYVQIALNVIHKPATDVLRIEIRKITGTGLAIIDYNDKTSVTQNDLHAFEFNIDCLYFARDTIDNTIRSEHRYASPTLMINKKIIPSVPHAKEINVNLREDETVTSVNPYADWSVSSNVLTITSPTELSYEILSSSNCTNLLTIQDVSSNYLTNIGFEDGRYQNDWQNHATSPFTSIDVVTNIVFEGYYSLKLYDTDGSGDYMRAIEYLLPSDSYYYSFSYYVESFSGTDFRLITRQGTSSQIHVLDTSTTERWITVFFYDYIEPEASGICFDFNFNSAQGTIYLDNFKIAQTSTTIETVESDKYLIYNYLHSWDGYQNPILEGSQILNTTLLERSSQTVEYTTNLTSTTGIFELEYTQALEHKEYELRTYSYSSGEFNNCSFYFTPSEPSQTDYAETELGDSWDFSEGDLEGFTSASGVSNTRVVEDGKYTAVKLVDGSFIKERKDFSLDADYYNTFTIRIYSNKTNPSFSVQPYVQSCYVVNSVYFEPNKWVTITRPFNENWMVTSGMCMKYATVSAWEMYIVDYIKLVHIDEPSYLETDQYLYHTSQNNSYSYAVYSDDQYLGSFTDLQPIPFNNTEMDSNHNITTVLYTNSLDSNRAYLTETFEYLYYVESYFSVNVENFYVSDTYINFYATSNKDYTYSIYENNIYKSGGSGNFEGTTISSERTTTQGVTIEYAIKFVNSSSIIWFNTSYSNADSTFYVTYYNIEIGDNDIIITWDTTKDSIDFLTIYEDGIEKVSDDPDSTSSYTKSEVIGTHYVTLVFEASGYDTIIFDFSYTIASDDPNYVKVAFFSYSILGTINVLLLTHWGNQTIDIYDNTTLIAEDYVEGTIICFFEITEGFHNISVEIWNSANLWETLYFGFTINLEFEALTINYFFFDVNNETYSVGFSTNWFNQTAYVYENDVLQGTVEEYITEVYDRPQDYGVYYNITVVINSYVYQFGFQNPAAPEVIDNYLINLEYDYDLSGSLNILIYTYFGNQTIDIYDNATLLVDDSNEGDITTTYLVVEGYHNITVEIHNGGDLWRALRFGFIIDFAEEIYDVHIDLFSQVGSGILFSEAKCYMNYVNDAYRLNQDFETTQTSFTIHIVDYFNTTLKTYFVYALNSSIVNYLEFMIMYYEFELENPYNCIVIVELERNDHLVYFTLNANETIRFYVSEGEYTISCAPFNSADYDPTNYEFETSYKLAKHTIELDMKQVDTHFDITKFFYAFVVPLGVVVGTCGVIYVYLIKPSRAFAHKYDLNTWDVIKSGGSKKYVKQIQKRNKR